MGVHTAKDLADTDPMALQSKSIKNLEQRMENLPPESLRYRVLECAKQFKSSWIELGQHLYAVYKDKHYREWGYATFEFYCAKEIGVRQQTAVKLLKSYYFLEKEEPEYLKGRNEDKPAGVPSFESVNALRLAKQSDRISEKDYGKIREDVLEKGSEPSEVKKKIKYFLKPVTQKEVSEADLKSDAAKKMIAYLENSLGSLTNLSFPNKVLKKIEELLELLQGYK